MFFEEVESSLRKTEQFVNEQTKKEKDMHDAVNKLIEYKRVLIDTKDILAAHHHRIAEARSGSISNASINAAPIDTERGEPLMIDDPN